MGARACESGAGGGAKHAPIPAVHLPMEAVRAARDTLSAAAGGAYLPRAAPVPAPPPRMATEPARTPPPRAPASRIPPFVRALLRVPLFYKILIANAVLVLVGTVLGSMATVAYVRAQPGRSPVELTLGLALVGIAVTVGMNALILRVALAPLELLERTAARVQGGDVDSRAPVSPVADRELDRLTRTFNAMLDAGAAYRARLREIAARALGAAEEERKRIARELHDETAQMLAALLIRIRLVRGAPDAEKMAALLDDMREQVAQALEGIRRFARGLRPPALDELGLVPAIEGYARGLQETSGLRLTVSANGVGEGLAPETELAAYRIVQEALSNVLRHARATHAEVSVVREPHALVLTVHDDGRGFDPQNAMSTEGGGLGLFGMRERAGYVGGTVNITSAPGAGTRVRAEIPLGDGASVDAMSQESSTKSSF